MAAITSRPATGQPILVQRFDVQSSTAKQSVGTEILCTDGCVFVYGLVGEAITGQSYVCVQNSTTGQWYMETTTLAATRPAVVGISAYNGATTNAYYQWFCVKKPGNASPGLGVRTDANVAVSVGLCCGSTAGQQLATTATTESRKTGLRLLTATPTTAAAANTSFEMDRPKYISLT